MTLFISWFLPVPEEARHPDWNLLFTPIYWPHPNPGWPEAGPFRNPSRLVHFTALTLPG